MNQNFAKITFTENVKEIQKRFGSRTHYSQAEKSGDRFELTSNEIYFLESKDSFYLSSVGENSWPYIQHRGGKKGFLKIINNSTLGIADFSGNKQYISTGNFIGNNKSMLFLIDYPTQSRLKIWVETQIIELGENKELENILIDKDYKAKVERLLLFHIKAYDWNCNQHITPRYTIEEVNNIIEKQTY